MKANEIRTKYLEYFRGLGHTIVPSASIVPENDPTTLFTGSGMQPMLPYFLGQPHPLGRRITDSQKSFRAQDIDEVGDNRHTTFFEMLGNWSFGDYFKNEQIEWMFNFLINEIGLDPQNLYVTCYQGNESLNIPKDTEAATLWQNLFAQKEIIANIIEDSEKNGMQGGRIFFYNDKKNWWSRSGTPDKMPEGEPGGPDTEMFWDFGEHLNLHQNSQWKDVPCHVNCDCGRFMEIGNNVFMQYVKKDGGFELLPKPNVDFGGGLERVAAALKNDPDMFNIDIFDNAKKFLEYATGFAYTHDEKTTRAYRVVLDHVRAAVFLISDGVLPSNTERGYILRRWLRRAIRYADSINAPHQILKDVAQTFVDYYYEQYPNLRELNSKILNTINEEEDRFRKTLEQGIKEFSRRIASGKLSGNDAFELFTTYGFPFEMTLEMANEAGVKINEEEYLEALKNHQALSRAGSEQKFKGGLAGHDTMSVKYHTATHLLQQALRTVLGTHVAQKGSNITPERLRFDFSHNEKMTDEQKKQVEDLVNQQIKASLPVTFEDLPLDVAKTRGAIGLFEEKYGDVVRVYKIGDFSLEFCGGPHVENTSELGVFKINKEEAVQAGVRRIKATLQ